MNRILFEPAEIEPDGCVMLRDFRAEHIRNVLKAVPGKVLKTGVVNGLCGYSTVMEISDVGILLETSHQEESPQPWFDVILAAPRPLALKRLWPQLTALGAGKIFLVKAEKVEKYYFSSQWVRPESVKSLLVEGAVQAGLTHIPDFEIRMDFRRFMNEEFDKMAPKYFPLLAHPGPVQSLELPADQNLRPLIAVGPEGGWTDNELEMFEDCGFALFSLGERILRSDTACIALISVMDYALHSHLQQRCGKLCPDVLPPAEGE
ncbi:MAG: RsmE family RNA methyltransferase [Kiritimatiellia bacterium]